MKFQIQKEYVGTFWKDNSVLKDLDNYFVKNGIESILKNSYPGKFYSGHFGCSVERVKVGDLEVTIIFVANSFNSLNTDMKGEINLKCEDVDTRGEATEILTLLAQYMPFNSKKYPTSGFKIGKISCH